MFLIILVISDNVVIKASLPNIFSIFFITESFKKTVSNYGYPSYDGKIFELRTKVSSDITRILYFFVIEQKIILTNGFVKKTQKTPKNEIDLAKRRRNEYLNR